MCVSHQDDAVGGQRPPSRISSLQFRFANSKLAVASRSLRDVRVQRRDEDGTEVKKPLFCVIDDFAFA